MTIIYQHRDQLVAAARAAQREPPLTASSRRRHLRRLGTPLYAALAAIVVPAVAAAALGLGHAARFETWLPGQPSPTVNTAKPPVAGRPPSPALTALFGALKQPRGADDIFPAQRAIDAPNFYADQTHRAPAATALSGPVRVVPEAVYIAGGLGNQVCLVIVPQPATPGLQGATGICQPAHEATAGHAFMTLERDGGAYVDVFGLVPDGVRTVTLTQLNGLSSTLAVNNNVYSAAVTGQPRAVSYTNSGRPVRVIVGG